MATPTTDDDAVADLERLGGVVRVGVERLAAAAHADHDLAHDALRNAAGDPTDLAEDTGVSGHRWLSLHDQPPSRSSHARAC
jgi:hypothetical protein